MAPRGCALKCNACEPGGGEIEDDIYRSGCRVALLYLVKGHLHNVTGVVVDIGLPLPAGPEWDTVVGIDETCL